MLLFVSKSIGSNITSLIVQRRLAESSDGLSRTMERLASGLRINRASDDPAGLAVALGLKADVSIQRQALRNINDGISLLQITDSALEQLHAVLLRQRELATQAANGVLSLAQRRALNAEAEALSSEFNRIVGSTTFNGIHVLDPASQPISIQAGQGANNIISFHPAEAFGRTVGDGTFGAGTAWYSWGGFGIAAADLNNDGHADFVTGGNGHVAITLGNGDGSFEAAVYYSDLAGDYSHKIVIGDVNGDGKPDLMATHSGSAAFSVLLGNGNGTFGASVTFATGTDPYGITAADLNGDGKLDVAVKTRTGGTVDLFIGNGNGSFLARATLSSPGIGTDLEAGDLNNDSFVDLAVAGANTELNKIYLNDGSGGFTLAQNITLTGNWYYGVEMADFNRDGILDVALGGSGTADLAVALGNGDGTFLAGQGFDISTGNTECVIAADLNGDGITDLAGVSKIAAAGCQLNILLGNGNGTFKTSQSEVYLDPELPVQLYVADFSEDGAPDLVFGDTSDVPSYVILGDTQQTGAMPYLDLTSQGGAQAAMNTIDENIERVLSARGAAGAAMSRLEIAANNAAAMIADYQTAAGRITDADIAEETARMIREQILQQAAIAILAQANQEPALVLSLIDSATGT